MKLTPEQAARELRIFWGPMNESQITEEIKEFYRSRSFRDCDIIFENNDYGRNGGVERVGEPYTSGFWKQQSVTTRKVPLRGLHSFQSTSRPYTNSGLQTHTFGRATAREPVSSRGIVYKTVRGRNQGDTVFSRTQPTVGFQAPQSNPFTLQPNPFTTQTNPLTTQTNVFTTQTNTLNTQPPRAFQNTNIPNIPTTRNNINNTLPRQAPTPRIVISAKEEPRGLIHSIARLLLPWGTGPQNQNNSIDIPARASDPRPQVRPSYPMLIRNSLHRYFTSEGSEVPLPPVPGMITAPPVTSTSFPLYNLLPAGVSSSTRSTSPAPHPVFAFQPITTPPQYTTSTTHHRRVDPIQYYLEWVGYTLHLDTLAWETIDFMAFLTFVPWAIVMFVFWLAHFLGFVIP